MRRLLKQLAVMPVASLFVWLGVATLVHPVLAAGCFASAALGMFSTQLGRFLGLLQSIGGWKGRAARGLATATLGLVGVVLVAAFATRGPPPGSH